MLKLNCCTMGWEDPAAPQSYRLILPVSAAATVGALNKRNEQVDVKCSQGSVGNLINMSIEYSRIGWGSLLCV